jgi:transcriptional regulator with XRE-family HTH domain
MTDRPGPTLRRRKLVKELIAARRNAGMSLKQLAEEVDLQPGTISKIENNKQAILARNIKAIGRATGLRKAKIDSLDDDSDDWMHDRRADAPSWFVPYAELEADAVQIWTYTSEAVDGLLQTHAYAEAVARIAFPAISDDELQRIIELRQARQEHLDRVNPPRLHVVMNEAVIRRSAGDESVARDQLRHLADSAAKPNITLQVLPFEAGLHPGMKSPFTLLRFSDAFADMDCVYLENENGGVWQEQPQEVSRYIDLFARLAKQALSPEDTAAMLATLR